MWCSSWCAISRRSGFLRVPSFTRLEQAELKAVNDKVEALEAQCAKTLAEKKRLADEAETTANRLVRAEKLTSGLASEGVRWLASLESLGKQKVMFIRQDWRGGGGGGARDNACHSR